MNFHEATRLPLKVQPRGRGLGEQRLDRCENGVL